ncbi:MAG: apolipoprotein N-acyltransferase, partial [Paracoccaceae bacterium]
MKQLAERLVSLTGWSRWAVSATMGVALGMAHTPFGIWPLAFVAGAVLCLQWRAGGGFAVGWAAGAAFFAVTLHWIVEPFLVDAARYGWMAPFALVLMAGGLALFWGAAFWIAGYFRRAGIAALALCWAVGEALRGGIFTGFPWALPAYIWLDTPIAQLASILGPYGLSLITLLAITGLGAGTVKWAAPVILLAGIGAWVWGDFRQGDGLTAATDTTVRIIQPNIPQAQKWDASFARQNFERTLALTSA